MGYVQCRSCHGIGKKIFNRRDKNGRYYEKAVDCKACSGTGINQKFYSKNESWPCFKKLLVYLKLKKSV